MDAAASCLDVKTKKLRERETPLPNTVLAPTTKVAVRLQMAVSVSVAATPHPDG